ncbi:hypothetical protein [Streptomyces sp. NPDC058545]|uniref:hypothetical protein n=1 Tax=Streptomyces sp. NPDC058545 TaxID=3346544 RepID=UPI003648474C
MAATTAEVHIDRRRADRPSTAATHQAIRKPGREAAPTGEPTTAARTATTTMTEI